MVIVRMRIDVQICNLRNIFKVNSNVSKNIQYNDKKD